MTWKLAPSLGVLRQQVDEVAPKRSKKSDGTIGDAAHAARKSDHNPDKRGVVTAIDLTHDPKNGADMEAFAERLRLSKDRRIKYVIWNRRTFSGDLKPLWTWRPYKGASPHDKHMHVSVQGTANLADDKAEWVIELASDDEMTVTQARLELAAAWHARSGVWMTPQPPESAQARLTRLAGEVASKTRTVVEIVQFAPVGVAVDEPIPAWVVDPSIVTP